jgi:integrase
MSKHVQDREEKIAQQLPSRISGRHSEAYWQKRLYWIGPDRAEHPASDKKPPGAPYGMRLFAHGERRRIELETPSLKVAATRARAIYEAVKLLGWDEGIFSIFPGRRERRTPVEKVTLGDYIGIARKVFTNARPESFDGYCRAARRLAAFISKVPDPGARKFDYRNGGRDAWLERVDRTPLATITAEAVDQIKPQYLARAGNDEIALRSARVSFNSTLRQAASLFAPSVVEAVGKSLSLPDPLPLKGARGIRVARKGYTSRIDLPEILKAAASEAESGDSAVALIVLLAGFAGLRRGEIDNLRWRDIDAKRGAIRVLPSEHYALKTGDSEGEVAIEPEVAELLIGLRAKAQAGPANYVIPSDRTPGRRQYRTEAALRAATAWLRKQGVAAHKPLHELRKEVGAIIASSHGIYAAAHVLRHSSIQTTAQFYAAQKTRVTAGLGSILRAADQPENVVPIKQPAKSRSRATASRH